jgi:hypothetical protein
MEGESRHGLCRCALCLQRAPGRWRCTRISSSSEEGTFRQFRFSRCWSEIAPRIVVSRLHWMCATTKKIKSNIYGNKTRRERISNLHYTLTFQTLRQPTPPHAFMRNLPFQRKAMNGWNVWTEKWRRRKKRHSLVCPLLRPLLLLLRSWARLLA